MKNTMAPFWIAALALWVIGSVGAISYAQQQNIPQAVWMAVLPALLLEATMYIGTGFAGVRERVARLRGWLPAAMAASAVVPYLIFSVPVGSFRMEWMGTLIVLSIVVGLWYRLAPKGLLFDLLFLGLVAGIFLSRLFPTIYENPAGKPSLDIVGRLMWIRLGIYAVLLVRGAERVDFGFVPQARHWWIGAKYFLLSIPLVGIVAWSIGFVRMRDVSSFSGKTALVAVGTFIGMLWVTALAEEFFFRGLLQQWMQKLTGSLVWGIAITSCLFGAAHLPMRGFPNIKFALVATIAGVFYGLAYARSGSIRASMVTHALVNTAWRVFFV
ncbi:MAG: CPBP family intramembrane metalloprotease [Acidobacteria bacterium]|nr:CPBP family intramembrane metalloprotease [Acidobacteriota bacterium]